MRHRILPNVILAVVALVLTVAITVGWNVIFASYYGSAFSEADGALKKTAYWFIMAVGDLFLATVITAIAISLGVMVRRSRLLAAQNAFIDRITHELRTPIAALRLAVDTCTRHELDPAATRQQLTDMRGDLDRLQDLVDHVIDAGRMEHAEWRPRLEIIDVTHIAESCIQRVVERYQLPGEAVRSEVESTLPVIRSDRVAVEHIISNLLDNACKYSDAQPEVTLAIAPAPGAIRISVSDRGIGIPSKEKTRIFRRFYRVPSERNRPGTGLGLYVIAQLCRQLGGRITTQARPGGGSVFTVHVPLGAAHA